MIQHCHMIADIHRNSISCYWTLSDLIELSCPPLSDCCVCYIGVHCLTCGFAMLLTAQSIWGVACTSNFHGADCAIFSIYHSLQTHTISGYAWSSSIENNSTDHGLLWYVGALVSRSMVAWPMILRRVTPAIGHITMDHGATGHTTTHPNHMCHTCS